MGMKNKVIDSTIRKEEGSTVNASSINEINSANENNKSGSSSSINQNDDEKPTKNRHQSHKEKIQKLIDTIKQTQENMNLKSEQNSQITLDFKRMKNTGAIFRNRFQAQKDIIETQKSKLQEQEKIINDLKMGILTDDVKYTLNKNKYEISEIFSDCKSKLIGKVPLEYVPTNEREAIAIKTQNAPKIAQELEKRALERMQYREMIKERKRILEETKQKMHEEALERKRCLEEEEKKKQLELIKERRREELEKTKLRQAKKERYLRSLQKAVDFYDVKLLKNSFIRWKYEYKWSCEKLVISEERYKTALLRKCFESLRHVVEISYVVKYTTADELWRKKTMKKVFEAFKQNHIESVRSMQVAEDFYDFHLQSKTLSHWRRYICKENVLGQIKNQQADYHFKRKILFHYFHCWISLPTVLKLEKAKEERKQKWRQKVWEILPDFNPFDLD